MALPVNLAAGKLSSAAVRWFRRLRQTDDLSRLVRAASGTSIHLSRDEVSKLRSLLTREQTWQLLAGGRLDEKLQELTGQIAGCLPPREGWTAENAREAAGAIARGLLEFAVYDLQPDIFQKVVLTRLRNMADEAGALDTALLRMHKDLYHLAGEARDLFRGVMDRLPPGPADLNEIKIYLKTLIRWLNSDPWPRDQRLGGPVLTPAAIERKLRISGTSSADEQDAEDTAPDQDADELARQCARLVILGGPGSGKTWLAKRSARICAEEALLALAGNAALDEVELPLYCTFSQLVNVGGDIRQAVVSSALHRIGDLGGSRVTAALDAFFAERNARTLLIVDSLDETYGADQRLDEVRSLPPAWRIILTSRPGSWDYRLVIDDKNKSHRVGELQPLRYPDDVEAIIRNWFREVPDRGQDLAAQIAQRRDLQNAVTVPLILAFYCIIGGNEPVPEFRHELFSRVLRRMLTGRWRGSRVPLQRLEAALRTLRNWAMTGADCDPLSGVGRWADEITPEPSGPGEAEDALDHVATPLGPPDVDTGLVWRRFIHRSLREHLVAEYVAGLPVESAAEALLPHLWYDTDWEYVAPAAIAMHNHRDQLLRALVRRINGSERIPDDVSVLDAGWEVRHLLARIAAETRKDDWSPEIAAVIAQARLQLARSGRTDDLAGAWEPSNRQVRDVLLALLADQSSARKDGDTVSGLVSAIARLSPAAEDRHHARETFVKLFGSPAISEWLAARVVQGVVQLATTAHDKRQARDALLSLLAGQNRRYAATLVSGTVQLITTVRDRQHVRRALLELLAHQRDGQVAAKLAAGVVQLAPTAHDKHQARDALLGLLADQQDGRVALALADSLTRITPTASDRDRARGALIKVLISQTDRAVADKLLHGIIELSPHRRDRREARSTLLEVLASQVDPSVAAKLVRGVIELAPSVNDKRHAHGALLELLASQASAEVAGELVDGIVQLGPGTPDEHHARRACETLFRLLAGQSDRDPHGEWTAAKLIHGVVYLARTAPDRRNARQALLRLLAGQNSDGVADALVKGLARLALTARDRRETRDGLLCLLPGHASPVVARRIVYGLSIFAPTAQDQRKAREALIGLLPRQGDVFVFSQMVDLVVWLALATRDRRQAREALLELLVRQASGLYLCSHAELLAGGLARLGPTAGERGRARETLLGLLADQTDSFHAALLAGGLAHLAVTRRQQRQASGILVRLLASGADIWAAERLAASLVQVEPETKDRHQALDTLAGLLADDSGYSFDGHPAKGFVQLAATAEDKRHMREILIGLLATRDNVWSALRLAEGLSRLAPTVRDRQLAREALLKLLPNHLQSHAGTALVNLVVQLAPAARDKRQAREGLLGILADHASNWPGGDWHARALVDAVLQLAPTPQDKGQARGTLLGILAGEIEQIVAHEVVSGVVQLALTPQDKRQTREAMLERLNDVLDESGSYALEEELLGGVAQLSPTADDVITLTEWWIQPPTELLASARPNSSLASWLTAVRGDSNHAQLAYEW